MNFFLKRLAGLAVVVLFACGVNFAQLDTGALSGTVTDPSGAVVSGATVTVKNLQTNAQRTVQSSSNGSYTLSGLSAGQYQVTVESTGFQPFKGQVEITVGGHLTVDAQLSVSSSATQVEVLAEGGTQVNTQNQEISQIVGTRQMANLPSLTRNAYDFVALSGNVSGGDSNQAALSNKSGQNDSFYGVGYSMNGQRSTGTEILLDGMENNDLFGDAAGITVPLDTVNEYRVLTSNFDPQYGRASGGVVNVITKSGSNAFHGDAWEYNRLAAYTANTVYNAQNGQSKGSYTRNQFGYTIGGPIIKDKLFFFGSTEWLRVRSSAVVQSAVPTPQLLALSDPAVQAYFNAYGNNNFNFTQTISAGDAGITAPGVPSSTPAFGVVAFNSPTDAGGGVPQNTYNIVLRGDYNINDKTSMFLRSVYYHEVDQAGANYHSPYSQYNVGGLTKQQATLLSVSHIFSPSLATTGKISFSRLIANDSFNTALEQVPTLFVSANATVPGTGFPIQLPGFYDQNPANGGLPYGGPQNTIQWNQDLNWTKGNHNMQYGGQVLYIQSNRAYGAYAQAGEQLGNNRTAGLNNLVTGDVFQFIAAVDPQGALPCVENPYTGNLTQTPGCTINLPVSQPSFARSDRFHDWAVYGQDAWKLSPRFTFNYGVRYEYYGVQHNNHENLDSNFYYGSDSNYFQSIRDGEVFTTPNSPIKSLWSPSYGTVSPRIGFAWDVNGDGKTSIRGGYGITYERNFGNVTFNVIQNPPAQAVIVINNTHVTNSNAGPLGGSSGSVALPPTSLRNVDQHIKTAQTQFWSLAVERQLARNTVLSAQYVAARGTHLYDIKNINGLGSGNVLLGDPVLDPNGSGNYAPTRLNPQFSDINNRGSNGDSYYQGFNLSFQTTDFKSTGLSLTANYTFAHAIDDISSTFSANSNDFNLGYTDPFNPALDRGASDIDIRHRIVVAPIYELPFFKQNRSWLGQVAGNWSMSGIFTAHSGVPITFFDSTNNYSGYNVARYTPTGPISKKSFKDGGATLGGDLYQIGSLPAATSWANPLFANVDPVHYPNGFSDWGPWPSTMTARNAFSGPGAWNFDAVVTKKFPITERVNMEFRAEGFNVLNHHNFYVLMVDNDVANYGDGVSIPMYGQKGGVSGGPYDERRFGQFALKVNF